MKKPSALLLTVLMMSQPLFAADFITTKMRANPNASVYQILEEAFSQASDPIVKSDIRSIDEWTIEYNQYDKRESVLFALFPNVTPTTQLKDLEVGGFAAIEVKVKGLEAKGPMFPEDPRYHSREYSFCSKQKGLQFKDGYYTREFVNCLNLKKAFGEWAELNSVAVTTYHQAQIDVRDKAFGWERIIYFRKSGNLIFMRTEDKGQTTYNYLWIGESATYYK